MVTRVLTNKSSCRAETISEIQKGDLLNLSDLRTLGLISAKVHPCMFGLH